MNVFDLIRKHESLRLKVYDDWDGRDIKAGVMVNGHPTIGYGIALDVGGITESEAESLMRTRVSNAEMQLKDYLWWHDIGPVRRAVCVDMVYQLGFSGFKGFKRMIAALGKADYPLAAKEALDSRWAREQTPARAKELAEMLRTGNWPS